MCGIFGHYFYEVDHSKREVLDTLFNGLQRLEYRGYDSAGISVDWDAAAASETGASSKPLVMKTAGKVSDLSKMAFGQLNSEDMDLQAVVSSHIGIAHTRWATHGPPCSRNSHPHASSEQREFVVVHNGTITNYRALKEFLMKEDETFVSDTDTEVIPKLLKFLHNKVQHPISFPELVSEVAKQLEGAYALLIQSPLYPGELVACRRGSPLIMGVKQGSATPAVEQPIIRSTSLSVKLASRDAKWFHEQLDAIAETDSLECYMASEASAVVEHTKQVIYLEDNDLVHVVDGSYTVYNFASGESPEEVRRTVQTLTMEVSQIMKGGYNHYMEKEINEQPDTLCQTMQGRVSTDPLPAIQGPDPYTISRVRLGGLIDHAKTVKRSRRLVFVACGTSYYACMASRQTVEELTDLPVTVEIASDLLDRRPPIYRDDTCFFVSQSGETADTIIALKYARSCGALCVGITNSVGSAIDRETDAGIHINAGCEIGVASTKAYTSQIITMTLLALSLAEDHISKRPICDGIIDGLAAVPAAVKAALRLDAEVQSLAEDLKGEESLLVFGRGRNYATAMEAALKVKEVSYMHSEGINAGEMKHGPLALVDEKLPIVVIATQDAMHSKMQGVIQQLLARNARLIVLCNEGDTETEEVAAGRCQLLRVPRVHDALQPVVNIVPFQLLAYHLTILRGYNVDQPRNLAKSVTVTEE